MEKPYQTTDDWGADFLMVQDHLDALDETLPANLELRQFRRWVDFVAMIEAQALRFRRADTFKVEDQASEGIVHQRVRRAFDRPEDKRMIRSLYLSRHLYISCFTTNCENTRLWSAFGPQSNDVCVVTSAGALKDTKPLSVCMLRVEYGIDWDGPNPSDQIFQDRMDYESICTVEGLEYETSGDFSFARPLKFLLNRFRHQNEVRLVYCPVSCTLDGYSTWVAFEADDYGPNVCLVTFDLSRVRSEVLVRSDALDDHKSQVRQCLRTINSNASVTRSCYP